MYRPIRQIISGVIILLLCTWTAGSIACREAPPVLKVGCQGDPAFRQALAIAIEEIERSGSPVRVEVVFDKNDRWTPPRVVRSAEEFCRDPDIQAVIGFTSSDASLVAARMFSRCGIPQIIPTATSPQLLDAGSWTFKLCPNDEHQARFLANVAFDHLGARRCALIFQNNDYGRGLADFFREEFIQRGGEITRASLAGSGFSDQDMLELYVREITRSEPDLLVLICQPQQAQKVMEELDRQKSTLPLLSSDSMASQKAQDMRSLFEGMVMTLFYHPDLPFPGNTAFVDRFRELYGDDPCYQSALSYDALMLLHQAVLEGARTREEIREYLSSLVDGAPPFQGVAGPITFNEKREVSGRSYYRGVIRDGNLIRETDREEYADEN